MAGACPWYMSAECFVGLLYEGGYHEHALVNVTEPMTVCFIDGKRLTLNDKRQTIIALQS